MLHWLRVLAASGFIAVLAGFMLQTHYGGPRLGAALFNVLERTLYWGCWILVPLMTADCISRERREGTLGLLFLTPLSVADVVAGKGCVHALRAVTLFLAAIPVLGLPLVLGGVGWFHFLGMVVNAGSVVLLGIAAGLYASSRGGTAIQAMVRAEFFAGVLLILSRAWGPDLTLLLARNRFPGNWVLVVYFGWTLAGAVLVSWLLFRATARRLGETWHQEPENPEQPRWVRLFSDSDFWRTAFRWNKNSTLDRNPIAWLQEYSWTARLTKWGWFLAALVFEFYALSQWQLRRTMNWHFIITAGLAAGVAFSAAGSFRRERQSGLLELLLTTPLSVRQLLAGRLWGFFCHYFPALAVLTLGWIGDLVLHPTAYERGYMHSLLVHPVAIVSIMVIGPCLAIRRLHFLIAWGLTWVIGYVAPNFWFWSFLRSGGADPAVALAVVCATQAILAAALWVMLFRRLKARSFLTAADN
jgi:ABC-type transport system involved in multi-copper enzyme maturation permease subunit